MLTLDRPPYLPDLLSADEIAVVIRRFYDKIYADPILSPLFADIPQPQQEQRLAGFVRMTRGRSSNHDGAALRGVHAHLPITPGLLTRRAGLLAAAIREAGHGEAVLACWRRYDAVWWRHLLG